LFSISLAHYCGVDYNSRYPIETQQRIWKDIERQFRMKKIRIVPLLPSTCKSLADFKTVKHHHGIPEKLEKLKHIFNPGSSLVLAFALNPANANKTMIALVPCSLFLIPAIPMIRY
jgi:hypothetical protein